jgi:hypothetical protein
MKIKDIIAEAVRGKMHPDHESVQRSVTLSRDSGGYDRTNYSNRKWMATAMADGKDPTKPVDMDAYSWIEKYNTEHPYTQEEYNMFRQADATIPGDIKKIEPWSKSKEPNDVHKVSPHRNPGPITLKK